MNKKKILSLILCCFMVLSVGCSESKEELTIEEEIKKNVSSPYLNGKINDVIVAEGEYLEFLVSLKDGVSLDELKYQMNFDAVGIYQGLEILDYLDYERITISYVVPIADVYGNKEDKLIRTTFITTEEIRKINFDNFNSNNLPLVAEIWDYEELDQY